VNDILDFAKIEAGKLELHNREFDLDELLKGLVGSLAFTAGAKDVELVLAVSPQVPAKVIGDSLRLQQVIMNLAGNAVKFTDQGEVCVSVAMETENSAAITLRFTVRDTGIGIAKDQQPFLFDAFFQADSSNRRKYGGTGLGLPITRGLIEHLGGTLDFSSEIGKGSEFTFTIPLQRVPDYPGFEPLDAAWQNARILIADDNASARQALQQQLEANSLRTVAAQDTASALQLLRQASADNDPFRAALIDATLPGLVAEICQDPGLAGLPVIVLLPVGSKVDGHLADSTRFTRTLTKPFSRPELRAALRGLAKATAPLPVTLAGESVQWAGQGLEVLLAEDNVTNQKIMTLLLDKLGLKADIAGNGLEVLEKMAAKKYALVLMDVQMPDLDGLEATKRIRDPHGLILHHQVPIIAVTAHAIDGYSEVCSRAGMDDYIAKPITLQKLREVLERWLPTAS